MTHALLQRRLDRREVVRARRLAHRDHVRADPRGGGEPPPLERLEACRRLEVALLLESPVELGDRAAREADDLARPPGRAEAGDRPCVARADGVRLPDVLAPAEPLRAAAARGQEQQEGHERHGRAAHSCDSSVEGAR